MQINSASYVWIDKPSQTEKRYPAEINKRYPILNYSMTYDKPLYAIVTLTEDEADIKGTKAGFLPPTPEELNMNDSIGVFPWFRVLRMPKSDSKKLKKSWKQAHK